MERLLVAYIYGDRCGELVLIYIRNAISLRVCIAYGSVTIQEINIYDFLDQREIYVVEANIRNIIVNLTNYYLKISV